jgi:hypothetical protein
MALITDPDDLSDAATDTANVFVDTTNFTIKVTPGRGSLVAADGVTLKCLYSFLTEEWINDPNSKGLAALDFPLSPITDNFFQLVQTSDCAWTWADSTTEQTIRRGGWEVINAAGNTTQHWAAVALLASGATDQCYYDLGAGATNFTFTGNTAEAVQVISDPNGDGNYTDGYDYSSNITVYNRTQGKKYASASSTANGEASLKAPILFSFTLRADTDLDISASDATIASSAPYTGMSIEFFTTAQARTIGASSRNFGIIVDGNGGTAKQIYEFVQYSLRQSSDEDSGAGSLIGNVMPELLEFVGPTLKTKNSANYQGGGVGVFIDSFAAADTNSLVFRDNTSTERSFPFVAAGFLQFNAVLQNDPDAVYRVFFTDGVTSGNEFGDPAAIFVDDNSGADLVGSVGGNAQIAFTYDYDGNTQGGRSAGADVNVTAIAIGKTSQYVKTTAVIGRSNANTISFVSVTDRQYENV